MVLVHLAEFVLRVEFLQLAQLYVCIQKTQQPFFSELFSIAILSRACLDKSSSVNVRKWPRPLRRVVLSIPQSGGTSRSEVFFSYLHAGELLCLRCVHRAVVDPAAVGEEHTHPFLECVSLCLSRACLGKMIIFTLETGSKKTSSYLLVMFMKKLPQPR